jgi:RNA polymerase sigma-70 factor (ECF subfamily)
MYEDPYDVTNPPAESLAGQVAQCAVGLKKADVGALGRLYDCAGPRLLRYATALVRNKFDAEDAVQAAFVRIAQQPRAFAAARLPWPYLLRVVRNEGLKIVQKKQQRRTSASVADAESVDEILVEHEESAAVVRSALERLPQEQAEVVVLKIWEEMTFAEIAEVTSESLNTVASRYRYALDKLSRSLESLASEYC